MQGRRNRSLLLLLNKIPVFSGLSPTQLQKVLTVCTHRTLDEGKTLFACRTPSEEMYVLLSGELSVRKPDDTEITILKPIVTVGEMGVVTKDPRTVSVVTTVPSSFDIILNGDLEIAVTILKNMVRLMSSRLDTENVRNCDFDSQVKLLSRSEKELALAYELLAEKGMSAEQAAGAIAERLRCATPEPV